MNNVVAPNNNDQSGSGRRNIFEDPAIAAAANNDPFARFVTHNWKNIAVVLLAIALGMLGYSRFMTTQEQKRAEVTQVVRDIQANYNQLIAKQDELQKQQLAEKQTADSTQKIEVLSKEIQDLHTKTKLKVDALEASGSFVGVARLYHGLLAVRGGDMEKTKSVLDSSSWEQEGAFGSPERLVAELATYTLAKSLLDSDKYVDLAKSTLKSLAERGSVTAAQSVLALGTVATTDAEKSEVRKLAKSVGKRLPTQQKFLLNPHDD